MDWKNKYALGIEEIDSQHRELLHLFESISEAVNHQQPWSDVHYRVVELRSCAEFHFEFEEALMRMFGYPQARQHAAMHQNFFPRLDEIMRSSIVNTVQQEVVKFLCDWLTEHIMKSDRDYAEHILAGASIVRSGAT